MTPSLLTESDVKEKIVSPWLCAHGFGPADVSLETTFEVQLGRMSKTVRPKSMRGRCDYLVRAMDGRNLMIIETKAPGEALDLATRDQGISYARALKTGGIAPFVLTTNGTRAELYDTITGALVSGTGIPSDHPYVQNRFRVTTHDFTLRAAALDAFIGLSSENFTEFCRSIVSDRMQLLRSDDIHSGKKYVPKLWVPRIKAEEQLEKFLSMGTHTVTLVTGRPQSGKTNFLCGFVERELEKGSPCLFYPAVSLDGSFLDALKEDFCWSFNDGTALVHVAHKLQHLAERSGRPLTIFVDGWNEVDSDIAQALNLACQRLKNFGVRFVISATRSSLRRLLIDPLNNIRFIGDAIGVTVANLPLLEIDPKRMPNESRIVMIEDFSEDEVIKAYSVYSEAFGVSVPDSHRRTNDPFLLGLAMRLYRGCSLPKDLQEPVLIRSAVRERAARLGVEPEVVENTLSIIAEEMFAAGSPVLERDIVAKLGLPACEGVPSGYFDAALLLRVPNKERPQLDFYYSRERDFFIASARDWDAKLSSPAMSEEIDRAMVSNAGVDAIKWYWARPNNIVCLLAAAKQLTAVTVPLGRQCILSSIARNLAQRTDDFDGYLAGYYQCIDEGVRHGLKDSDKQVQLEALKLRVVITDEYESDGFVDEIAIEKVDIRCLLSIEEEFPLLADSAGRLVLDAFCALHPATGEDELTKNLIVLLETDAEQSLREAAATAFGYIDAELFWAYYSRRRREHDPKQSWFGNRYSGFPVSGGPLSETWVDDAYAGIISSADAYIEMLVGPEMCPGYLRTLDDDPAEKAQEYARVEALISPVLDLLEEEQSEGLRKILRLLSPKPTTG